MNEIILLKNETNLTDKEVIGELFQEMDEGKDFVSTSNNYVWFYLIGKYFGPKIIVEMGTRFGYSMKAFVDGAGHSPEEYTLWSVDAECDGIKTLHIFETYFRSKGFKDIRTLRCDTRQIDRLGVENADLCLVDGCHTIPGAYNECCIGWKTLRSGGVLVVDDTNYDAPRKGAEQFCSEVGVHFTTLPSFRGTYLVVKP